MSRKVWLRKLLTCPGSGGCGAVAQVPIHCLPLRSCAIASKESPMRTHVKALAKNLFMGAASQKPPADMNIVRRLIAVAVSTPQKSLAQHARHLSQSTVKERVTSKPEVSRRTIVRLILAPRRVLEILPELKVSHERRKKTQLLSDGETRDCKDTTLVASQNSRCSLKEGISTGPRSRLYPGFTMCWSPGAT